MCRVGEEGEMILKVDATCKKSKKKVTKEDEKETPVSQVWFSCATTAAQDDAENNETRGETRNSAEPLIKDTSRHSEYRANLAGFEVRSRLT